MQIGVKELSPIEGQIVGFISLTLPVFLYFYLTEKSKAAATLGKRVLKIKVKSLHSSGSIFMRNFIKFLPWEIAHVGGHWMGYYTNHAIDPPLWVWIVLIIPQLTVLYYMFSIVRTKGDSSLYDRIAGTEIIKHG